MSRLQELIDAIPKEPDYDYVPAQTMKIRRREAIIRAQVEARRHVLYDPVIDWEQLRRLERFEKEFGQ